MISLLFIEICCIFNYVDVRKYDLIVLRMKRMIKLLILINWIKRFLFYEDISCFILVLEKVIL